MDEIEVLIKIPKEDYEFIYDEFADGDMPDGKSLTRTTLYAIAKGTVLPKGHGRLIDSKLLDKRLNFVLNHTGGYKKTLVGTGIVIAMTENLDAPTVIEAESEGSE